MKFLTITTITSVLMYSNALIAASTTSNTDPLLDQSMRHSFEQMISQNEIDKKLEEAANQIDNHLGGEELTIIMIMKGAICVTADLMRNLESPCTLEFIQTSSYGANGAQRGELVIHGIEKLNIAGKNVLIVDDIFDSGMTLSKVVQRMKELGPKSVQTLVLLSKNVPNKVDYRPDYVLFDIEDRFVIGYGMDYKERWRELPGVFAVK